MIDPFDAISSHCAAVWSGLLPPRVEAFFWLAMLGKILTADVLRRRGLVSDTISYMCCLCGREMESVDHFFIHCGVTSSIWGFFLKQCEVTLCFPGSLPMAFEDRRRAPMGGNGTILWRIILFFHSLVNLER